MIVLSRHPLLAHEQTCRRDRIIKTYDYVIVGGGSSACVAAWRLTTMYRARVLVLERANRRINRIMRMPAGYSKYIERDTYLEMHQSVPASNLNGRAPIVPQAKVLGGGSAVNAMVYARGQAKDYDDWDTYLGGNSGWAYEDVLPAFKNIENNARLNDAFHGVGGPLDVTDVSHVSEMTEAFILSAQEVGIPYNHDFNGAEQGGVGTMQYTIGRDKFRRRVRCDAASSFLKLAQDTGLVTVELGATVTKIDVKNGRAIGVRYDKSGAEHSVRPEHEVLVAAGTYNTAKLLMLSGLGPADHLRELDIPIVADLPGVGRNLQDHHEVPLVTKTRTGSATYYGQDKGWRMLKNGIEYLAFGSGPVGTTGVESCCFFDPEGSDRPIIQLYCVPTVYLDRDVKKEKAPGVTLTACLLRPKARGSVRLGSADPYERPKVDLNFFGHEDDLRRTIGALQFARKIVRAGPMADLTAKELMPGEHVQSDEDWRQYCVKQVKTNYHPVGTAKMGPQNDRDAVLDNKFNVRGVENLRVIDCSSVPFIPSGNTNAIALALGYRAASFANEGG